MIDYSAGKFWLDVLVVIWLVGQSIYLWISGKSTANKNEISTLRLEMQIELKKMDERNVAMKLRITELESDMKHMPTEQALSTLAIQFHGLHGDLKKLTAELEGIRKLQDVMRSQTQLMDEFLRKSR